MRNSSGRALATLTALGLTLTLAGGCLVTVAPDDDTSGTTGGDTGTTTDTPACDAKEIVGDASFAPTSGPDRAYFKLVAATSEVVFASTGNGLHRSEDGGETWTFVEAAEVRGQTIHAMVALGKEVFVTVDAAVYRTSDGGETWQNVSSGDCLSPGYLSVRGDDLFGLANGRAFQWNPAKTQWDALPFGEQMFDVLESDGESLYADSIYSPGVYRLHLNQPDAQWLAVPGLPTWGYRAFAFTAGHGFAANTTGIFHSVDDGATWTPLDIGGEADVADLLLTDQGLSAATNAGLRISLDHGATWKSAWKEGFQSGFALAESGGSLFAASDGVRRAKGPDQEWTRLHVLADSISWLLSTETAVLAMTSGGNFVRSSDDGATWADVVLPGGSFYYWGQPLVARNGKLFGLDGDKSLLVSSDGGASFVPLALPAPIAGSWVNLLASNDKGLIVGVSTGAGSGCEDAQDATTTLYLSTDEGQTWNAAMNTFPVTFTDCYDIDYTPMITSLVQAGGALFATTYHGFFRSVDDGTSWLPVSTSADIGALRDFVTVGDSVFAIASGGGVARSSDAGATWKKVGLATLQVSAFTVVKDTLFASVGSAAPADDGVYSSSDLGETWTRVDAAFDARVGPIAAVGGRLFAGTLDESIWSVELSCAATR